MKTIWRFNLDEAYTVLELPKSAVFLTARYHNDKTSLWFEVQTTLPIVERHFRIIGTGHEVPNDEKLTYLGTVFQSFLVWHIYETEGKP